MEKNSESITGTPPARYFHTSVESVVSKMRAVTVRIDIGSCCLADMMMHTEWGVTIYGN